MMKQHRSKIIALSVALLIATFVILAPLPSEGAGALDFNPYRATAPDIDVNLLKAGIRKATSAQLAALDSFKATYGSQATIRWNPFAGSPDVMMGFHTAPSSDAPETVARAFIAQNSTLFGVGTSSLALVSQKEALGGYLLRFQQQVGGVDVAGGGLGFVMDSDKRIRMVMGSTYRDVNISTVPALTATTAAAAAQTALAQYAVSRPASAEQYLAPAFDAIESQIAPALREPLLNVFPTADGYRLAWSVVTYSRNPFGVFVTQIDATSGQILSRENMVRYQSALPFTADIYPNHPTLVNPDTGELKLDQNGEPEGLLRVHLRSFNQGMNVTGVNGTLSGPHALVQNVLATKQPFEQAALGTFHFRQNNQPLEAQPNEADDLAEPAEHIDEVNLFFFINYLLEYVDDIHRRDDSVNNRIGQGSFPDTYPNSDKPLVGLAHLPNIVGPTDTSSPDAIIRSSLGFDNAFSLPLSGTILPPDGPKFIVNPTTYGHGYLFNDLGKDGAVAYHEGMHSISTPIAGLEGAPEGGALNEGQADLWAYTITDAEAIGEYVVQGARIRQAVRDGQIFANETGRDPNRLAWIRSVHSTLKYSQFGTRGTANAFEVHRDGEIYVATMWDLRYLMKALEPQLRFSRPAFLDGQPTRQITQGQESWERIFLGSLYILGLTSPDTFVKARDALIEADRLLYPTNPLDPDAPGLHEALIWQVFASHELGVNAASPAGGRQTISTRVTQFAADQAHVGAPQGITVVPASSKSLQVNWQPVSGAFAYEIFKRKVGTAGQRQFKGVPGREYFDGDASTNGWSHVAYVLTPTTSYEDKGPIAEFFGPAGIKSTSDASGFNEMLGTEYAVRALSINPNHQVGASDLSAGAAVNSSIQDVTAAIKATISNVRFANGVFEFDQTITNNGVASPDGVIYSPINFRIVHISDPSVTVKNADNGGDGQQTPASFIYNQSLAVGATSAPRHLQFNDSLAQLFTFDAVVTANVRLAPMAANGSQPGDGAGGAAPPNYTGTTTTFNGLIVLGSGGEQLVNGVDYVDVPFVAQPNSFGVNASLDAPTPLATTLPDLDFELLDDQDNVIGSSGNFGPREDLIAGITPGRTYRYRVIGFGSGPTEFTITSTMFFFGSGGAGGSTSSSTSFLPSTKGVTLVKLVRFTVNPLTKSVSLQLLN